jgi:hypothetical protein
MNARTHILLVLLVLVLVLGTLARMPAIASAGGEQALMATIKLRSGDMGSPDERARIVTLENQLSDAIKNSAVGEFDGDEYGNGVCTIYMYGPSADRLLTVTLPVLKKFRAPAGSYVIKRHGKPGAKQERISLSGD